MFTKPTTLVHSPLVVAMSMALPSLGALTTAVAAEHIPQPWVVQSCDDDGPFTLRDVIENKAQTGQVVDLSQLPAPCGTGSAITLTTGEITVAQDDLVIRGTPLASVVVSGGHASRIFHHTGAGSLTIDMLRLESGSDHENGDAAGGCVLSDAGMVVVHDSVVTDCTATSDTGRAVGGAISAKTGIELTHSTLSNSEARAVASFAVGGGVFTPGTLNATYSVMTDNRETDGPGAHGVGGSAFALSGAFIAASTIAGSSGFLGAAIASSGPTTLLESTISGNTAGGSDIVRITGGVTVAVANSTIAANHVEDTANAGALYIDTTTPPLIESSIIGMNTAGASNVGADLFVKSGSLDPGGLDNLIVASHVAAPPAGVITITQDPKLGPLQWNGGPTPTHQLMPDSPARGAGNDDIGSIIEQRGLGYPRASGGSVDIGAVQFDTIFVGDLDL